MMNIADELVKILGLESKEQLDLGDEVFLKDGFLSYRRRLKVKNEANNKEPLHLFLKMSDSSRSDLEHLQDISSLFCRIECQFYALFAPILDSVFTRCQLEQVYPRSYGQRFNDKSSILLMEDLANEGYSSASRMLTLQQAQSVMKAMGRLQAAFWIARTDVNYSADDTFFGFNSPFCDQFAKAGAAGKINVKQMIDANIPFFFENFESRVKDPNDVPVIREGMTKMIEPATNIMMGKVQYDHCSPLGFVHGDCWLSNFMFKDDGDAVRCRILDWQGWGVGRFGYDLGILFLTSLPNEIFNEEVENLFDLFYLTFKEIFEAKSGQPVPFRIEDARQNLALALQYGLFWIMITSRIALTVDALPMENVYANAACAIRSKRLQALDCFK